MAKKIEFAFLTIAVETGENSAAEAVGDWLQRLPPEWAGRATHGFVGMVLTDGPPDADDIAEMNNRYNAWYRPGKEVMN
jgi:hypothetical protein